MGNVINMESHAFSCYLGVIASVGKIVLALLVQLPYLLLMQLFPNRTRIHVITHTYYIIMDRGLSIVHAMGEVWGGSMARSCNFFLSQVTVSQVYIGIYILAMHIGMQSVICYEGNRDSYRFHAVSLNSSYTVGPVLIA